jgi:hypothetical protein
MSLKQFSEDFSYSQLNASSFIASTFLSSLPDHANRLLTLDPAREDAVKVQKLVRMSGNKNLEGGTDRTGLAKDFGVHAEQSLTAVRQQ